MTLVTRLCARCYDTDDMVWPESALTPVTVDVETLYDTGDNAELMWLSVCHISTRYAIRRPTEPGFARSPRQKFRRIDAAAPKPFPAATAHAAPDPMASSGIPKP